MTCEVEQERAEGGGDLEGSFHPGRKLRLREHLLSPLPHRPLATRVGVMHRPEPLLQVPRSFVLVSSFVDPV